MLFAKISPAGISWFTFFAQGLRKHNSQGRLVIDRILKGEKAVDLPMMQPTKFDFLIKLKTARALGRRVFW